MAARVADDIGPRLRRQPDCRRCHSRDTGPQPPWIGRNLIKPPPQGTGKAAQAGDQVAPSPRRQILISFKPLDQVAAGSLGLHLNEWVEARFGLPEPDLLDLSRETNPEIAAKALRQHWRIGEQPIVGLLALFETKGIRLFSLAENTASVNAFSFWRGGKPFIFLNNFKTAESSNFDAAHELGHLVMHKHGDPKGPDQDDLAEPDGADPRATLSTEREADRFASAFLMPASDLLARVPKGASVDVILKAKFRWRVSALALAQRLHSIGLRSEWQYNTDSG